MKKLSTGVIVITVFLAGIFSGCGSSAQPSNTGEAVVSAGSQNTEENNKTRETSEYEVGFDTYVSPYKYMITLSTINKGTNCAEVCGGTKGFYSVVAVQGIGEDTAQLYGIDLSEDFSDEGIIEAVRPSVYSMLGNLHDTKGDYPNISYHDDAADFKYDNISSVKIGDYDFTKATGQIVVYPAEYAEKDTQPYYMNMVLYARKLSSGNLFYYFEYNDCNISVLNVDGPIKLSIEDLAGNAEKNLKTFKEYEGDSRVLNREN